MPRVTATAHLAGLCADVVAKDLRDKQATGSGPRGSPRGRRGPVAAVMQDRAADGQALCRSFRVPLDGCRGGKYECPDINL
jgi:hypothetical protein